MTGWRTSSYCTAAGWCGWWRSPTARGGDPPTAGRPTPVPGFHPSGTQGRVGTWTIHCDCEDALPPGTPLTLSPLDAPDPIRARSRGFNPVELREDVVGTYLPDPLDRRPRVRRLSVFHGACRTCGEVYCAVSRTSERS